VGVLPLFVDKELRKVGHDTMLQLPLQKIKRKTEENTNP
jgi:hypothetical protein